MSNLTNNVVVGKSPLLVSAVPATTANINLSANQLGTLICTAGAAQTVKLPLLSTTTAGQTITIKSGVAATAVTVDQNASDVGNKIVTGTAAANTLAIAAFKAATLVSDGSNWYVTNVVA